MTRINIIPVAELYDQHLIAEYREILMVPGSLKRTLNSKVGFIPSKVPKNFTLNKGHVYFFYDKGLYLEKRYDQLIVEINKRGMYTDPKRVFPSLIYPSELFNNWEPTEADMTIVRERISLRVSQKPGWYRKTPQKIFIDDFNKIDI